MRSFALLFSSLISISAFAANVSNDDFFKSNDGKTLTCTTPDDVGQAGYQAMTPWVRGEERSVKINVTVDSVVCHQAADGYKFDLRFANDPITHIDDFDNSMTTQSFSNQAWIVRTEDAQRELGRIATDNVYMQVLQFDFPVDQKLSAVELGHLNAGETVSLRWELLLQGRTTYTVGKQSRSENFKGGTFVISFDLKQDQASRSVQVMNVRMVQAN